MLAFVSSFRENPLILPNQSPNVAPGTDRLHGSASARNGCLADTAESSKRVVALPGDPV